MEHPGVREPEPRYDIPGKKRSVISLLHKLAKRLYKGTVACDFTLSIRLFCTGIRLLAVKK